MISIAKLKFNVHGYGVRIHSSAMTLLGSLTRLRSEMMWIVIGQALTFVGGFAGIKILTNVMAPEGYGLLALGLTVTGLLNMFIFGPIGQVIIRYYSVYRERNELGAYFSLLKKAHLLSVAGIMIATLLSVIILYFTAGFEWALLILMAVLFGIASGVNGSFLSLQSAIRQRKIVALHQGLDPWLRVALAVAALALFKNNGAMALFGYFLGTTIITISQRYFAMRNEEITLCWHGSPSDKAFEKRSIHEMSSFGFSIVLLAVFGAVSMYSDRWILQGLLGTREVGIYAAMYQIANAPIALLMGMINQLMIPIIFERAGSIQNTSQIESSNALLYKTILLSGGISLVIAIGAYVFGEQLMRLFTSTAYAEHGKILWVIVVGLSLFNMAQLMSVKGHSYNQPRVNVLPKALQAASLLVFAFLFVGRLGLLGMGITLCGSSFVYLCAVYYVNVRLRLIRTGG